MGARFVITHSEYTQTDPVLATPAPQSVKTFADAGTQVELISDSSGCANPGPSGHSSHVNQASRPPDCNKFDKKKQESEENLNTDSKPKKLALFEPVYPSDEWSPNDPPFFPLAVNDDDNDEEYKCEMTDNAVSSSDDTDYELDSEEHPGRKFLVF